ncbi:ABC transporter ATP-binding protein [Lacibacterium aquatile]|uniref:ABC transporter ATP-binding protein n=1 Tax=Lacibacterium aquatile TaxID=1168082 RepID=A0ABW5DSU6_9PROT
MSDQGTDAPRLRLSGITKQFPGTRANDDVSLSLLPGEIHALLGENGAGKSTLVKIVYGLLAADAGTVEWEGEAVAFDGPAAARAAGIGMVFQHFSLFETLTVAENIALALPADQGGKELPARISEVAARYGLALDPHRPVHALSTGERQRVEIVRCLLQEPRLLIMDEPTSVLTPQEADTLFETLRKLASEGCTILYISHKLDEIRALCERATILRGGKVVGTANPREVSAKQLAEMMIGGLLTPPDRSHKIQGRDFRLKVSTMTLPADQPFGVDLQRIDFQVRPGEILGIAGLAGSGQGELLSALGGERLVEPDTIRFDGQFMGQLDVAERRRLGLAYVPEERLGRSAVPDMSLADNMLLSGWQDGALVQKGMIKPAEATSAAEKVIRAFRVAATGPAALARRLSGGNLQKFIMGREIGRTPKVLICANPTWGVDAGAAAQIHQALLDLARKGTSLVVISTDLDELFALSDKMAVLYHGRLSEALPLSELSVERVGLMMGGNFAGDSDAA